MQNRILDGGEAIVQALRSLSIDRVFSSPGSEWGSVWEAFARQDVEKLAGPTYMNCGHETLAVDLAIGYTTVSGRMQAVLLHAGSGLLQGSMGICSARALEIPLIVMSGESLTYGEDDAFDPGAQWYAYLTVVGGPQALMAPLVKWATQVTHPSTLYEMVIRAGEMAQRAPRGPTYLNVPIETMLHAWTPSNRTREVRPPPRQQAFVSDVKRVADLLVSAKNPLVVTESGGRDAESYDALIELADLLAIPVVESPVSTVANFPRDNVLHQGFDVQPMLGIADLVLVVRNRVPWYPPKNCPAQATVVVIDENPLKTHMVYQGLHADIFLEGDVPTTLRMLTTALRSSPADRPAIEARRQQCARGHAQIRENVRAATVRARGRSGIHSINLCATLGEVLPRDAIYVDETTSHRGQIHKFVQNHGYLSFVRVPSGLGQCLGMALGIKMASPDRPVVALIGDGAFVYNPLVAALGFARRANLPILVIVFNNCSYRGMRDNHLSYYPDGVAAKHQIFYGEVLDGADYEHLASGFDAVGIRVEAAVDLKPALQRGYRAVENGRLAILNVLLEP